MEAGWASGPGRRGSETAREGGQITGSKKTAWKIEAVGRAAHEGADIAVLAAEHGISRDTVHAHARSYRRAHNLPPNPRPAAKPKPPTPTELAPFSRKRKVATRHGGQAKPVSGQKPMPIETARCACGVVVPAVQLADHQAAPTRCEMTRIATQQGGRPTFDQLRRMRGRLEGPVDAPRLAGVFMEAA